MFTGTLFRPQIPAAEKLCNRQRYLLAWEQGTGKTIIGLAAAEKLFDLGKASNALVLAQSSNAWQWADKADEFTDSTISLVSAQDKASRAYHLPKEPSYTITSWNLYRRDFSTIVKRPWDIVIADEAQEFKSLTSVTLKKMKQLNRAHDPVYRWALTGTAISTKLEELYNIMAWVDPTFFPSWPTFNKRHIIRNQFGGVESYKNLKGLHTSLHKRMDRKTHADQEGQMPRLMPPIIHKIPQSAEYKKSQAQLLKLLDNMVAHISFNTSGELEGAPRDSAVSKGFAEARQLLTSSEKLAYAVRLAEEILAENPTNRVVIFSHFKQPLYDLQKQFGVRAVLFTGDQDSSTKRANTHEFLHSEDVRILLGSDAASAGLDLYTANYIINLDVPPYGTRDQRNKRITRLSSTHSSATVHYLITEDSWEDFYYQVVDNIEKMAKAVQEGGDDTVTIRTESFRAFARGKSEAVLPTKKTRKAPKRATGTAKRVTQAKPASAKRRTTRSNNRTSRR